MRKVLVFSLFLFALAFCYAQQPQEEKKTARVVLYKQGLGYVEKYVNVEGDASIELIFDEKDIPDVLNSLVVVDLGGGVVTNIGYESKTPREKLLSEVLGGRDVAGLVGILTLFKGAQAVFQTAGAEIQGRIAGVEEYQKNKEQKSWRVTVMRDNGNIETFDIFDITSFKLSDELLQKDLQKYLKLYSEVFRKEQKKIVINTKGQGKRQVFIAYTLELPVWKTTHRFVLRGNKALCQSWAVVDNTTMEEWKDVNMTLVCGVPVTFQYDIYSPLFTLRQKISPTQSVAAPVEKPEEPYVSEEEGRVGAPGAPMAQKEDTMALRKKAWGDKENEDSEKSFALKEPAPGARAALAMEKLASSVQSAIATATVGDYFIYNIAHKVSVGSKSSAMIPIVNKDMTSRKVAYWKYGSGLVSPYQAVEITNETGLVLDAGPVTLFEEGNYLGNAMMNRLQKGEKTLLLYALDQSLKVSDEWGKETTSAYLAVARDGYMVIKRWRIGQMKFKIENTADEERLLILDYPKASGWDVLNDKSTYTEKDNYLRFEIKAAAKKTTEFELKLRRDDSQTFYLYNLSDKDIIFFFNERWINDKQKEQLMEIVKIRSQMYTTQQQMSQTQQQIRDIFDDQTRLRENIKTLTGDGVAEREMRNSYVTKFKEQETKLAQLREQLSGLQAKLNELSAKLSDYISRIVFENTLEK